MSLSTSDVDKMLEDRDISGLIDIIVRASDPRYDPTCEAAAYLHIGSLER
jgi:hypothetical protein